jgi:hypothetical protein
MNRPAGELNGRLDLWAAFIDDGAGRNDTADTLQATTAATSSAKMQEDRVGLILAS